MTNKDNLQKELLEKVKPGLKPSDIKKQGKKQDKTPLSPPSTVQSEDEGYESEELSEEETVSRPERSDSKKTPNQQIKNLQTEISSLKKRLATYQDFKEADLKIKEKLKGEIEQLNISLNNLNHKNIEYKETISKLQTKIKEQSKSM